MHSHIPPLNAWLTRFQLPHDHDHGVGLSRSSHHANGTALDIHPDMHNRYGLCHNGTAFVHTHPPTTKLADTVGQHSLTRLSSWFSPARDNLRVVLFGDLLCMRPPSLRAQDRRALLRTRVQNSYVNTATPPHMHACILTHPPWRVSTVFKRPGSTVDCVTSNANSFPIQQLAAGRHLVSRTPDGACCQVRVRPVAVCRSVH
jgi:hypothetical protein